MNIAKGLEKIVLQTKAIANLDIIVKFDGIIVKTSEFDNGIKYEDDDLFIKVSGDDKTSKLVLDMLMLHVLTYLNNSLYSISIDSFISDLIKGKVDHSLMNSYLKRFRITHNNKTLYLVECNTFNETIYDVLSKLIEDFDHITIYESKIIIVKEENNHDFGKVIMNILNSELLCKCIVGYSETFNDIKDIKQAYDEALEAICVGKIFPNELNIYGYNDNKLNRLIYRMPKELIVDFINNYNLDSLNNEDYSTIQAVLKSNLNVAEASRKLFVHRNTLIYRIDKIAKETGLNIQNFDNAMVMKLLILMRNAIKLK